jgi:hypothetical protein
MGDESKLPSLRCATGIPKGETSAVTDSAKAVNAEIMQDSGQ